MRVDHAFAAFPRPDAVLPMILIGKAAPRPTQHGNFDLLQRRQNIIANSFRIRDRGVLANPNSLVNTSAQMFRKMTINVFIDFSFANVRVDDHIIFQNDALQMHNNIYPLIPEFRLMDCRKCFCANKNNINVGIIAKIAEPISCPIMR
ncbi:hypothetical protein D3C77_581310 [compost metagenome]